MSAASFSVPWNWKQALSVFFAAWIGLPVLLYFGLGFLANALPAAGWLIKGLSEGQVEAAFRFLILDSVAALLLVRYFLRRYKVGWDKVGLRPFNLVKGALYVLFYLVLFALILGALFALVSWLFPSFNPDEPQVNEFTRTAASNPRLSLLALVVIPAVVEETVFRGFIFPAFTDRFGLISGVVVSSLLFAIAHLQLNVSIYTFVLGCLLAMMYWKLKSIWPGIFLHLLNNYLAFTAIIGK